MRVAFFHELPEGGARIAVGEIAKYLGGKHEIDLYYSDAKPSKAGTEGFRKTYFYKFVPKKWKGHDFKTRAYKDSIELFKLRSLHKKIAREVDDRKYDLVFVHASKYIEAPFVLSFLKTTSAFYLHDPHFRTIYDQLLNKEKITGIRGTYEKLHKRLLKKYDRENLQNADYLIANSAYTQRQTRATYGYKSTVIYLGVDTHFFKPANIISKSIDVLYIGSHDLLDGYSIVKEVVKNIKNINVRTVFREDEWITHEKVRDLYRESRVVLCFGRNEPFGLIPIEALACSVPVIALDEGGYRETVIDGKNGFLVKNNSSAIQKKIMDLLNDTNKLKKMADFARKNAVQDWEWKSRIKDFEEVFVKIYNENNK